MLNRIAIFDGNHLAYRAYYKFGNLKTIDGVKTSIIFGVPYITESLIRRLGPNSAFVVFDGGSHFSRLELLPTYKRRDKKLGFDAEDFFRQKDESRNILMALGLKAVWKKGFEADDLITMLARRYSQHGHEIVIVSADKDFHQLIQPGKGKDGAIMMYNVSKGKMIDDYTLKLMVGYTPNQCVDYLCLTGDSSDNIPGYPGIGEKRGHQFLEKFGSIPRFSDSVESFGKMDKPKLRELYNRNRKIIDLKWFYRKYLFHEPIPWLNPDGGFQEKQLKEICSKYEINSFLKPQFINTFKRLK